MVNYSAGNEFDGGIIPVKHLLILCCFGGAPFIDYFKSQLEASRKGENWHTSTRMIDPTDWIATDLSGTLLNKTIHPHFLETNPQLISLIPTEPTLSLSNCDLFNLTFGSFSDENLFERFHGVLSCRCPTNRYGKSCEHSNLELKTLKTKLNYKLKKLVKPKKLIDKSMSMLNKTITTKTKPKKTTIHILFQHTTTVTSDLNLINSTMLVRFKKPIGLSAKTKLKPSTVFSPTKNGNKFSLLKQISNKTLKPPLTVTSITPTITMSSTTKEAVKLLHKPLRPLLQKTFLLSTSTKANNNLKPFSIANGLVNLLLIKNYTINFSQQHLPTNFTSNAQNVLYISPLSEMNADFYNQTSKRLTILFFIFVFFTIAALAILKMMRGCFCDCFGGFKNPFSTSERFNEPVDANALNRCLDAVRAYEENEKNKLLTDSRRPLISSVSESCSPYNLTNVIIPTPPQTTSQRGVDFLYLNNKQSLSDGKSHSPPPSYHSLNGSVENLEVFDRAIR